jgi:hypothetical protein
VAEEVDRAAILDRARHQFRLWCVTQSHRTTSPPHHQSLTTQPSYPMHVLVAPGSGHGIQSALVSLYIHMAVWGPDMCPRVSKRPSLSSIRIGRSSDKTTCLHIAGDVSRTFAWRSDSSAFPADGITTGVSGGMIHLGKLRGCMIACRAHTHHTPHTTRTHIHTTHRSQPSQGGSTTAHACTRGSRPHGVSSRAGDGRTLGDRPRKRRVGQGDAVSQRDLCSHTGTDHQHGCGGLTQWLTPCSAHNNAGLPPAPRPHARQFQCTHTAHTAHAHIHTC